MTSFTITGVSSAAQTLVDGERGVVTETGTLLVAGADAISGSGSIDIAILGTVIADGGTDANAIEVSGTAVDLVTGARSSIIGLDSTAVFLGATGAARAILAGEITGAVGGITLAAGATSTLTNSGAISASGITVSMAGTSAIVVNSGRIESTNSVALSIAQDTIATITNTGHIVSAINAAIQTGALDDVVFNAGIIRGSILLGAGNDTYDGRGGIVIGATVFGGAGDDTYILDDMTTAVQEGFGAGTDAIRVAADGALPANIEALTLLEGGDFSGSGNESDNFITGNSGSNVLHGYGGGDRLEGREGSDVLFGGDGNDSLFGGGGDDRIFGGAGNDDIISSTRGTRMTGDAGADLFSAVGIMGLIDYGAETGDFGIVVNNTGSVRYGLDAFRGRDTHRDIDAYFNVFTEIDGTRFADKILSSAGGETLNGGGGADLLLGEAGDDVLRGGDGSDRIFGGDGADRGLGGDGDDVVDGGAGDDFVQGGAGVDRLIGGSGRDTFVFETGFGEDRVIDYNTFTEKLDFSGHTRIEGIGDLVITETAGSAVILDPEGNRLVLAGVAAATVSAGDFIF